MTLKMKLIRIFFSLALAATAVQSQIQTLHYENSLNFVSGTFAEYLPDPIFYDTFLPIIFSIPVPMHMENALKLLWQHATVCNISDSRYDGKLCPVVHHLHKVVANLSSDMGFWKNFIPDSILPSDKIGSSIKIQPKCDEITPHFRSYYTTQDQVQSYLKYLEKCPLGQNLEIKTQSSNWMVDKNIYYTMIDRFYSEFHRHLPNTGNIDWVVTLNSYTAIQGIMMSNNYMESNRLKNAFMDCQNGRIPEAFVTTQMLKESLKTLKGKVYASHFKYLWEKNEDLSMYYKLSITDCTFTEDRNLLIRILIPVKISEIEAKLLQLRTFPFIERSKKSLNLENNVEEKIKLCMLDTPGNMKMVETNSGLLFETTCKPNELCKSSELESFLPTDVCTSSVTLNNDDLITKHCKIKCFPVEKKSLPIIRRKTSDTFIAVGTPDDKIFINCNGQPLEQLNLKNIGALEIKLACNCQISYAYQVFRPTEDCSNDHPPSVKHILPFQWNKFSSNKTLTILNATEEENIILDGLEKEDLSEMKRYEYKIDREVDEGKKNNGDQKADKQIFVEPTSEEHSSGFLIQICLLWIFIVILVASNIFLIYQIYVLIKWKKVQAYKDTRIVYSVPASPQFTSKF